MAHRIQACLELARAITDTRTVEEVYIAALDALGHGLGVSRAAILLFDPDGVMRFKAWRGLSDDYRAAVEGHTPWQPHTPNPQPIVIEDALADAGLAAHAEAFRQAGIRGLVFIPLVNADRVLGKFMLYYDTPVAVGEDALELAAVLAAQVAFAVERTRAEARARESEERLRFALDAAMMGTWDWDLLTQSVQWSDNLEQIHGLPPGTFDGTFDSYAREIHPDDRERVFASVQRALTGEGDHEVEYRLVAPDGTMRWAEGKGRVHFSEGRPVRMSGVCMIVTRRKQSELDRLEAAHEAARLKDEFLATLSHELRTPLNAILGWVQIIESGMASPDRMQDALKVIGRNARMQAQLIEDILDVSRIISGKLEVELAPLPIRQSIINAANSALPAALARNVRLEVNVPAVLPTVNGDTNRLQQVFGNVLSNAIKFTDSGGTVHLDVAIEAAHVVIDVKDTGIGIAPEFLPFVFDRFRQGDSRTTRRHGGLGLGLAIAKHIVDMHAGTIDVRSPGPGMGTTIRLRLPVASDAAETPAAREPVRAALQNVRVLVVDDNDDTRDLVKALFESAGARVVDAPSAARGLEQAAVQRPHLVIADIGLPDIDGCAFVEAFRQAFPGVPSIAVSGYARPEDAARARDAGFDAYHAKPIVASDLLDLASGILKRRATVV